MASNIESVPLFQNLPEEVKNHAPETVDRLEAALFFIQQATTYQAPRTRAGIGSEARLTITQPSLPLWPRRRMPSASTWKRSGSQPRGKTTARFARSCVPTHCAHRSASYGTMRYIFGFQRTTFNRSKPCGSRSRSLLTTKHSSSRLIGPTSHDFGTSNRDQAR
jgi:hypothetical protein